MNIDYHISVEVHLYGVPYRLVGATMSVHFTATMLEVLHAQHTCSPCMHAVR